MAIRAKKNKVIKNSNSLEPNLSKFKNKDLKQSNFPSFNFSSVFFK